MLNEAQHRAKIAPGHCLISACPGAGKTTVLSHRAAHLLGTFSTGNLCAVTFTGEAAADLVARIRAKTSGHDRRIRAGTFHKLAKDQLAEAKIRVRLITEGQARALTILCIKQSGESIDLDEAMSYIQEAKSKIDVPRVQSKKEGDLESIYQAYEQALKDRGVNDFHDLIILAVNGMRSKTVKPLEIAFMLVDEAQDADDLQWAWVMEHANNGCQVTVVGDDDQTIYGWRHAAGYKGMQTFLARTGATYVALDTTYRCAPEILRHAATIIAYNNDRLQKELVTANEKSGLARAVAASDRESELSMIVGQIVRDNAPDEWAVLARTNSLLDGLEGMLQTAEIPFRRIGGTSIWERARPALLLSLLDSICNGSILGFEALMQAMKVNPSIIEKILSASQPKRAGSFARFLDMQLSPSLEGSPVWQLQSCALAWKYWLHRFVPVLLLSVKTFMDGYLPPVKQKKEDSAPLLHLCVSIITGMEGPLDGRLNRVGRKKQKDVPGVSLITLHGCKGLEYDRVWIMGCEEGVLPDNRSDVEEERRLMYVGMTRARKELIISGVENTFSEKSMSRFIGEADLKLTVF